MLIASLSLLRSRRPHRMSHERSRRRRSLQDLAAEGRTFFFGEWRGGPMLTELHGLAQGVEKDFAIRTIAEVGADLPADFAGQFVIQVGRETLENFDTISFPVTLVRGGLAGAWICVYSVGHGGASS